MVFVCRHSGNARLLRRNNPRVIDDVYTLASTALERCGFEPDALVEHDVRPYPVLRDGVELERLEDHEVYRLLRLSRRNVQAPEVFSGMRLEHGFLKLKSADADYFVLRRGEAIVAGIGYVWDDIDRKIRIIELVHVDEQCGGTVLDLGMREIEERFDPAVIHIDVSAYAPRIQKTLSLLGFAPAAYCPSMVYVAGERLDVVKMQKLRVPPKFESACFIEATQPLADLVTEAVLELATGADVDDALRQVHVFEGLDDVQIHTLASRAIDRPYRSGERLFEEGSDGSAMMVILEGSVTVVDDDTGIAIATLEAGEVLGEMALIDELQRSAGAVCEEDARVLTLRAVDFDMLCRADPAMGFIVARNIARTLSRRIRAMQT